MKPARRLAFSVSLGALALAAGGSWALLAGATGVPPPPPARVPVDRAAAVAPPPFERFSEAEQRPLFAAMRRPAPPPAPAAASGPPPPYRFEGTVVIGGRRQAILADGRRTHRVAEGETLGEWRVTRIDAGCARLEAAGRELAVCKRAGGAASQ